MNTWRTRWMPTPRTAPHRAALLGLLTLAVSLLGACSAETRITLDNPPSLLGDVVDSVAVVPFEREPQVAINDSDLQQFSTALQDALRERPGLTIYDEPPTQFPNTARLRGTLERFEVYDQTGDGLFLRTLDLQVKVHVRVLGNGIDTDIRRQITWQKVYDQGAPVPSMTFDLNRAARELMEQVAEAVHPLQDELVMVIRDPVVPGWDSKLKERRMENANIAATNLLLKRAEQWWSLLLYQPVEEPLPGLYRLSDKALRTLRAENVAEDTVKLLEEELYEESPMHLPDYLSALRDVLGQNQKTLMSRVLELSVYEDERARVILATAHRNLAALYGSEGKRDLQAWHLAQAFGYLPEQGTLEDWSTLMQDRGMLPDQPAPRNLVMDYQRTPPPPNGRSLPGAFALTVMEPPAWQRIDLQAPVSAAPSAGSSDLPPPVAVPPVQAPQAAGGGLPAVETPETLQSGGNPLTPLAPTPTQP